MGAVIIQYHPYAFSLGIMRIHQFTHELSKVGGFLGVRRLGMSPATMTVKADEDIGDPLRSYS